MDHLNIGENIKKFRCFAGLTQFDLAEGICSQAQISKIESGNGVPSSYLLMEIARKLDVDPIELMTSLDDNKGDELVDNISILVKKRNYLEAFETIKILKRTSDASNKKLYQYLMWQESICSFYLDKNSKKSLRLLKKAFDITDKRTAFYSEVQIEILISTANIYAEIKNFEKSIEYFNLVLFSIENKHFRHNPNLLIKAYYGISKSLSLNSEYSQAIFYCELGIQLCLNKDILYLLGELFYEKGCNLYYVSKKEEGLNCINKAIEIFEVKENFEYIRFIESQLELIGYKRSQSLDKHIISS
ncbi:helix-turn-helix domain-containing protein [Bacillus cereus]